MPTSKKNEESCSSITPEIEQMPNTSSVEPRKRLRICALLPFLMLMIAVAALLTAIYAFYNNTNTRQRESEENKKLTTQLHQLQQQQNDLEQRLITASTEQQHTNQELEHKFTDFSKQVDLISLQKGVQSQDWLLLKARYYLELAQINSHWDSNANEHTTTELLEQADAILAQMNNSDLFKIRQIIANEIMTLKAVQVLDIPGLLSQLDALQNSLSQLNFDITMNANNGLNTLHDKATTAAASWKNHLQNSLSFLSKLVVVRRNDEEIKPLLSPVYESILKESIRLNLQQAQWALIHNNQDVYQLALKQALATLKRGFNAHLSYTTALVKQLEQMQKIKITKEQPKVGQALPLLNQLIEQKLQSKPENTNNNKEQEL